MTATIKEFLRTIAESPDIETLPGAHLTDAGRAELAFAALNYFKGNARELLERDGLDWECSALKTNMGHHTPADCAWPECGCDPAASKVIEVLEERGVFRTSNAALTSEWLVMRAERDGLEKALRTALETLEASPFAAIGVHAEAIKAARDTLASK